MLTTPAPRAHHNGGAGRQVTEGSRIPREAVRRQQDNALLYVRGLVEQGGRKSLQLTLFRLEETAARYESLQQFLVDSPWEPQLVIRACADRVRPRIGLVAWAVDDTGIVRTASILWGCEAAD